MYTLFSVLAASWSMSDSTSTTDCQTTTRHDRSGRQALGRERSRWVSSVSGVAGSLLFAE